MKRPGKQKPRLGWLYVVCHDNAPDLVKIGETDRPIERMRELDNPTILARVPVMSAYDKEQLLHRRFKSQQLPQSEYFRLDKQQLDSVLQSCSKWSAEVAELTIEPKAPAPDGVHEEQQKSEAEESHREWAELWLSNKPETPLEAEKREREEYQAWIKSIEKQPARQKEYVMPMIPDNIEEWLTNRDASQRRKGLEVMKARLKRLQSWRLTLGQTLQWEEWRNTPEGINHCWERSRCEEWIKALEESLSK